MPFTPVIIGVADVKNKTDEHKEPATLMLEAITSAVKDASVSEVQLKSSIDSIDVVRTWTWPYADLPGLLSERLGLSARPRWTRYTETHGGNQPAKLVDEAAGRIARGETTMAVVTGGEALASCELSLRKGGGGGRKIRELPRTGLKKLTNYFFSWKSNCMCEIRQPRAARLDEARGAGARGLLAQHRESRRRSVRLRPRRDEPEGREADMERDIGGMHSIGAPIQVYPLYENAFRAHRGQTPRDNSDESAALYAAFAKVAAQNPYSWSHGRAPAGKEEIRTVSRRNRMICSPCKGSTSGCGCGSDEASC